MTALLSRPGVSLQALERTLVVSGEVDVNAAADLAAAGIQWLTKSSLNAVVLDFSAVPNASSVAISVLFEWLRSCQRQRINIEAIALSAPLQRLTSLAELDELIEQPSAVL